MYLIQNQIPVWNLRKPVFLPVIFLFCKKGTADLVFIFSVSPNSELFPSADSMSKRILHDFSVNAEIIFIFFSVQPGNQHGTYLSHAFCKRNLSAWNCAAFLVQNQSRLCPRQNLCRKVHSFFIFVCSEHYGISISNHYPVPFFHDRLSFSTACFSPVYSISCTENLRF